MKCLGAFCVYHKTDYKMLRACVFVYEETDVFKNFNNAQRRYSEVLPSENFRITYVF